jgi:glycosyltransferase involved in cell wall biosynthesis
VSRSPRGRRLVILNWRDRRHPLAGGAELYCARVARELAGVGERVVLVTSRPAGTLAREHVDGYDVRRLGGARSVYLLALLWLLRNRASISAVIDSQNGVPFFSPVVMARQTPVVLLVHYVHQDLFPLYLKPTAAWLAKWLEAGASRRIYGHRTVVALSPSARADVRRRLRLKGRIVVVPCGADEPPPVARRSPEPRIVVVGRLVAHKRLDILVDAMAQVVRVLPTAELHLVGDGPMRCALEAHAQEARAPVVFHGRVADARRDDILGSAWLTVSTSAREGWGLSLIEANAAGVPALARRVSGLQDAVLHGETGWLIEPSTDDYSEVITRSLELLSDPAVAAVFAEHSRAWAAHFSWVRTAADLSLILRQEADRLKRGSCSEGDRRNANDVMTVVTFAERAIPGDGWHALLRTTDKWSMVGGSVRCLLAGADDRDALFALRRHGVDISDPSISVVVARHADVLA